MNVVLFYLFAAVIVLFSFLTVTTRRILHAAVFLLFVLIATSGIYFMLQYPFLAAVQLTLYAGGIVVLIVFSILLTSGIDDRFAYLKLKKGLATGLLAASGFGAVVLALMQYPFEEVALTSKETTMHEIGTSLLSYETNGYVLPFEVISVLLLAATFAAIVTAKKKEKEADSLTDKTLES
jgi:NADH-quinone oxidoreductase subunit J